MACGSAKSLQGIRVVPPPRAPTPGRRAGVVVRSRSGQDADLSALDRRSLLELSVGASVSLMGFSPPPAVAEETEFSTFYGLATPPTSYGGYGGNAIEDPKYSFVYPSAWKSAAINKVQKGTQGIDCRVFNPRSKEMNAFVIALSRAGEDDKSFQLNDVDSTFQGFAAADYDIQDAVVSAINTTKNEREKGGRKFFDYDIDSPDVHYLSTITVRNGKVFAFFIKSPARQYAANEAAFKAMLDSFVTL
ncbi:hypothetical protein BSKO_08299 [Bryopsis sp. KO-2023]|nr:hypothetical protein BSKO_08299 [Bryopsis sp. KO-2023]